MPNTWLFQANPRIFDLEGFFATKPVEMLWLVTRYAAAIAVGDSVYLWRAIGGDDEARGVVAECRVIEPVTERPDDPASAAFWSALPDVAMPRPRARLRILRVAGARQIIQRRWVLEDPELHDLEVLRMANATNYRLHNIHARRLTYLWSRVGENWSYAEAVAALRSYDLLYGQAISRLLGSEVAQLSRVIGRPVTGCYNKIMNFRHLDPRDARDGMSGTGLQDRRAWAHFYSVASASIASSRLQTEFERLWRPGRDEVAISATDTDRLEAERLSTLSLTDLLQRYANVRDGAENGPDILIQQRRAFARDGLVVAIARARAGSRCEWPGCGHVLFEDAGGREYVEVHHIVPLAEGGADTPDNVACVCPAHHREAHMGRQADAIRTGLIAVRASAA